MNMQFRVEKGRTEIISCSVVIGLNIIVMRYNKRSIKLVQVSQSIIDMSHNEDPLSIFHSNNLNSSSNSLNNSSNKINNINNPIVINSNNNNNNEIIQLN